MDEGIVRLQIMVLVLVSCGSGLCCRPSDVKLPPSSEFDPCSPLKMETACFSETQPICWLQQHAGVSEQRCITQRSLRKQCTLTHSQMSHAVKRRRGRRGMHPLILNFRTRRKWVVSFAPRPPLYQLNERSGICDYSGHFGGKVDLVPLTGLRHHYVTVGVFELPTEMLYWRKGIGKYMWL